MSEKTVHIIVEGKVQGVFYRATAKEMADKIGVNGWVRNREDDAVEIVASGTDQQLQDFIAWCRIGPQKAQVSDLIVETVASKTYDQFEIIRK